jgi:GT2 family glycosyltransferase
MSRSRVTAVIVTHNSPAVVRNVVDALLSQTAPPNRIVIVDCGSRAPANVQALAVLSSSVSVVCKENLGFAGGNNWAMRNFPETDYFLLVNPDAILAEDWLEKALDFATGPQGRGVGIISSPLRGLDADNLQPTGSWDSLGIYRSRLGRWYDRGQAKSINEVRLPAAAYEPPAIVGALMMIPQEVVQRLSDKNGLFDERLFTFKEDIELCLRVRKAGYRQVLLPWLTAFHCRGWPANRADTSYWARRLSARNDLLVAARHDRAMLPVYFLKYLYVTSAERLLLAVHRALRG